MISVVFKAFAIMLIMAVLMPSAIKLSHVFNHSEHIVCEDDNNHTTHFHQTDLECDFYKFKQTNTYYFDFVNYDIVDDVQNYFHQFTYYSFLDSHQRFTSFLRGPPQLV